jgi:hypothetical protein
MVFTAALTIGRNERRQKYIEISSEQNEMNNATPEINALIHPFPSSASSRKKSAGAHEFEM